MTTTPDGFLLVLAVMVPFVGVLMAFTLGGRSAQRIAGITIVAGLAVSITIAATMLQSGAGLVYLLGGWAPPLGVALRADNFALVMMLVVAVVILGIGLYARADFATPSGVREARAPLVLWTLLLAIWGSLNLMFLSGDLFTLYVALELLTFAAVPLVSLDGRAETLRAALRYLLFALLGSVFYLLGAVLLYGVYGTLDISLLAVRVGPEPATLVAAALMTTGLLAKTALVPLHLWLPPAHAGAPAAASAVLSGLVIKGSWFLVVRLWLEVLPGVVTAPASRGAGCGRDPARQPGRAAPAKAQVAGGVFDGGTDRLSVSDVSTRLRRCGAPGGRAADRRHAAGDLACHCEGRDVHGGRVDLQGARP